MAVNFLKERWPKKFASIYVLEMDLSPFKSNPIETNDDIDSKCISPIAPLLEFIRIRELEEPAWNGNYRTEIENRFHRADLCFAASIEGIVVSLIFVTKYNCFLGEGLRGLELPRDTADLYDVYTVTGWRGKGLYKRVFSYCVEECYNLGFKQAWMWIFLYDIRSLTVHKKLDMRNIILEVIMHQRWVLRWHKTRSFKMDSGDLLKPPREQLRLVSVTALLKGKSRHLDLCSGPKDPQKLC